MLCNVRFLFLSDEGTMLETLDYTVLIGSTPTFLYFDLYPYSPYAGHYVYTRYKNVGVLPIRMKVKSHVSSIGPSLERNRKQIKNRVSLNSNNHRVSDYLSYINSLGSLSIFCFSLTDNSIFQFVSQHFLRSTLHFMFPSDEATTLKTLDVLYRQYTNTTFVPLSVMDNLLGNSIQLLQITQ